jgi:iron complex transport system substrate-binding protein
MLPNIFFRVYAVFGLMFLALCSPYANAEKTHYPLEIANCGKTLVFRQAPSRTVSIGQSSTEILYMLGLSKRMVGTALWLSPVLKQYAAENAKVKRIADYSPSFESVLAVKPDFVTSQFLYHVGPKGKVGTRKQFADLGIPVYTSPADCAGKNNRAVGDGLREKPFSMALIYQEIRDLAEIYDVRDRGKALIVQLKKRELAALTKIRTITRSNKISAVFWFSSPQNGDPYVAGQKGAPAYMMKKLHIRNVINSDADWPNVGWETIAKANPTIIVMANMVRRLYPMDSIAAKRRFLMSDPVTKLMPAVRQGRVFYLDAQSMNPTIRTIMGLEKLAQDISAAGLTQ